MYELHLLHFLVKRFLLLASQEAIFNRPTESKKCFGLLINGREEGGRWIEEDFPLCSQNVSALILKKKLLPLITELLVILNHLRVCCDMVYHTVVLKKTSQSSKYYLKVVSATFLLVCFVCLKKSTCETRKNSFYFTSKTLFVLEIIKF